MTSAAQSLNLSEILKVNILLALLIWLKQHRVEELQALLSQNGESLRLAVVPWAFSPSDLMYLVEQEEELYVLVNKYQGLAKSKEQLQLVNR